MEPRRVKFVNGHRVEEFSWQSETTVYVDGAMSTESFEETIKQLEYERKVARGR